MPQRQKKTRDSKLSPIDPVTLHPTKRSHDDCSHPARHLRPNFSTRPKRMQECAHALCSSVITACCLPPCGQPVPVCNEVSESFASQSSPQAIEYFSQKLILRDRRKSSTSHATRIGQKHTFLPIRRKPIPVRPGCLPPRDYAQ